MPYGHITRLVREHNYGFLVDDAGLDWFFLGEDVRNNAFDELWLNERVGFSPRWTQKGPRASDIHFEQID